MENNIRIISPPEGVLDLKRPPDEQLRSDTSKFLSVFAQTILNKLVRSSWGAH
ncbi:hypothetical protein MYX75_02105 [Acidobacteria bacterium AH-259-A15]|nr:hypothetical protein [Acidobacteria bacterium AH-259-A15]